MNTLGSLLPGLREVRAPLAAGYLWLLALWLFYGGDNPDRSDARGLIERLYELEGLVSEIGLAVAVSFLAYLVGTLTEWGTTAAMRTQIARRMEWFDEYLRFQAETALMELDVDRDLIQERLQVVFDEKFSTSERRDELAAIRTALMVDHPLLHDDYDRLRAEAEFRLAIVLPLTWLVAILGLHFDSAFFWGFAAIVALAAQGTHYERRATAALIQSVVSDKVTPQYVEHQVRELSTRHRRIHAQTS